MSTHLPSLAAALAALLTLVACGSHTPRATDGGAPRCMNSGDVRTCQCAGGAGPAFTLACAVGPSDDACNTYTTTCVDEGFVACTTSNFSTHSLLEARCRAYCAKDGGVPETAPCSGW